MNRRTRLLVVLAIAAVAGCSSVTTVRVQPESVYVAPNLRPVAIIHANVTSAYVLFLPIYGHVDLDYVVNQLMLPTAKALGADKVVDIRVDITPGDGIWTFRKLLGWRSARATGVAVIVDRPPAAAPAPAAGSPPP